MSTLVSSFVQDRASGKQLPTASLISGAAKAWGVINAPAVPAAYKSSFNCSSLGDNGLGNFQPTYTATMQAVDYPVNVNVGGATTGIGAGYGVATTHCSVTSASTTWILNDVTGWLSFSVNGVVP